eukprot:scaffold22747_cov129-Isochrysis_galbana.AAC.1
MYATHRTPTRDDVHAVAPAVVEITACAKLVRTPCNVCCVGLRRLGNFSFSRFSSQRLRKS